MKAEYLTYAEKILMLAKTPELSLNWLSLLLSSTGNPLPESHESSVLKFLQTEALDFFLCKDGFAKYTRADFLKIYLHGCEATEAARRAGISPDKGRRWAREYAEYLERWARNTRDKYRAQDARDAQCAEACGRKPRHASGGMSGLNMCRDCPRRYTDA